MRNCDRERVIASTFEVDQAKRRAADELLSLRLSSDNLFKLMRLLNRITKLVRFDLGAMGKKSQPWFKKHLRTALKIGMAEITLLVARDKERTPK